MTQSNLSRARPAADHSAATPGDDVFTVDATTLLEAPIDGGAGNDTLRLVGGGEFALMLATISSIETIVGSELDDNIHLNAPTLNGVATIDGGGGSDVLWLYGDGGDLDFRGKSILGFSRIDVMSEQLAVTFNDKATALKLWAQTS